MAPSIFIVGPSVCLCVNITKIWNHFKNSSQSEGFTKESNMPKFILCEKR